MTKSGHTLETGRGSERDELSPRVRWAIRFCLALIVLGALYLYTVRKDAIAVDVIQAMKSALCL